MTEVSMDAIKAVLAEHKAAATPEKKELLKGRVEFSPEQEKEGERLAKDIFPQPGENPISSFGKTAMFIPKKVADGAYSVGESLGNLGLGVLQQGQPENARVTMGDMMRNMDGDKNLTSMELPRTQAYQQQAQQHPIMKAISTPAELLGSIGFPMGQLETGLMAAPIAIKEALAGAPAMAKLGALGKSVPIAQDVAQTMSAIQRSAAYTKIQQMLQNPLVGGAGAGAAYGAAFGAGDKFGQDRALPTPQESQNQAMAGGALGAGFGAAGKLLAQMNLKAMISKLAGQSNLPRIPDANSVRPPAEVTQSPNTLYNNYLSGIQKLQASGMPQKDILKRAQGIANAADKVAKHTGEAEYSEKAAKLRSDSTQFNLQATKTQDARAHSQQQTQTKQQFSQGQTKQKQQFSAQQASVKMKDNLDKMRERANTRVQEKAANIASVESKTGQHTDESDTIFNMIFDEIGTAKDIDHLNDLEKEIHASGQGPGGKPLLRGHQRSDLMRKLYARRRKIKPDEGPGESNVAGGSKRQSGQPGWFEQQLTVMDKALLQQMVENEHLDPRQRELAGIELANRKAAPTAQKPQEAPQKPAENKPAEEKPEAGLKTFLLGAFRKTMDVERFGNRENRYKYAVSADALAHEAGLKPEETAALKRWVGEMSEIRAELTYKKMQIQKLVEWADKNEHVWVGSQNKVKHTIREDEKGDMYRILEHADREGQYRRMALTYKMENSFESATGKDIEWTSAPKAGGGEELRPEGKPHLEVTTCGKVADSDWQANHNGTLEIEGGIKKLEPKFEPVKSADELFQKMESLMKWKKLFEGKLKDIKLGKGYDHLGNNSNPVELFGKVFENLKLPHVEGKAPDTYVWNVDNTGHVSTVCFHQPRSGKDLASIQPEVDQKLARMDKLLEKVTDKDGKINYDALWANERLMGKLLSYFPGLTEVGILGAIFGRRLHKIGKSFARASGADTVFAGTVDDILRDNVRFGGDAISEDFHNMLGEINGNFLTDKHGEWHPIESSEALADMLNEFKGVKLDKTSYRKQAVANAKNETEKTGAPFTHEELSTARKKADTALMIRSKQQRLADSIQTHLDEHKIRKTDAASGIPSNEGRKFYKSHDLDEQGRVLQSAHNPLFHAALEDLHNGLTLQPSKSGLGLGGFIGDTPARISQSIMRNNPSTAIKNLFDQAPMTLAYFHRNFLQAVVDMHAHPEVKEAIKRLPVIPAADMSNVQMQERLRDQRKPEDIGQYFFKSLDKLNNFLTTNKILDPIFHGKSPLVSAADREVFAKYSALASLYKSAESRGLDRHEFVADLINGKLRPEVQKATMAELSLGLSQTLNSVRPDLNKDLFASTAVGKLTSGYSTPGRRAMKLWVNWAKDSGTDSSAAMKLIGSFAGMVAFGGSGAVPASLQYIYKAAASLAGESEQAEKNLQSLDKFNVLRKLGIDWSANFGPDFVTNARPTLEAIEKLPMELMAAAAGAHNAGQMAFNVTSSLALNGLHMIPSIGPVGWNVWQKAIKAKQAAEDGMFMQYFEYNGQLQKVPIVGYTYLDALRHVMIGGYDPKASDAISQRKLDLAKKQDVKFQANKAIMPERDKPAKQLKDIFPIKGSPSES